MIQTLIEDLDRMLEEEKCKVRTLEKNIEHVQTMMTNLTEKMQLLFKVSN